MIRKARLLLGAACVVAAAGITVAVEPPLVLIALLLFPKIDTSVCAGPDPFCFQDGHPGVTGGAVVIGIGSAVVFAAALLLLTLLLRRNRAGVQEA